MAINTIKIASWLVDAWTEYMAANDKIRLTPRSEAWVSNKPHASQLSMCAKKHAASRLNLVEKEQFDMLTLRRIENGFRVGESVAEAVTWYSNTLNENNKRLGNGRFMEVITEEHLEDDYIAGTPDIILKYEDNTYPVEVKHTEHPYPIGFSFYQVVQLIGYMNILQAKTGYLFTAYPMNDANQTLSHRTWIVQENDLGDGWYVLDQFGNNVKTDFDSYPHTWDGTVYYTRDDYNQLVQSHYTWEKIILSDGLTEQIPSDIKGYSDWRCSRHIKEDFYKRKTGNFNVGDKKPGTGTTIPRCPLFATCYPDVVLDNGS